MVDVVTLLCGLTYSLMSAVLLPFYLILTFVMMTNPKITKLVSNRIVNQLNIADCGQLVIHFISGFFVLFPEQTEKNQTFVRIAGAFINSLWLGSFPILWLLAFTRILIILGYVSIYKMHFTLKILNIAGLLMGFSVLGFGLAGQHFTFTNLRWEYDNKKPFVVIVRSMELYAFTPCILLSYFAYVAVTIKIRMMRAVTRDSAMLYRHENRIFLQYFFVCSFVISLVIFWNISGTVLVSSNLQDFITNCCWILCSYINPIAVMVFNRTVRKAVLSFITIRLFSWSTIGNSTLVIPHPHTEAN